MQGHVNFVRLLVSLWTCLLLCPTANTFSMTSCVDLETPSTISQWRSTIPHKITQFNGSAAFTFEGSSTSQGMELDLKYGTKLKSAGVGNRVYFYVEYYNESPRRILVQPVKNEKGIDFTLLPGVSSDGNGFLDAVEELDVTKGEPSVTGILKKPQKVSVRKLVLFILRGNENVGQVLAQLRTKSCKEINSALSPLPTPPSSLQQQPVTVRPRTPTQNCGTGTDTTATATKATDTCSVCPECKCVCNCNCQQC